MMFSKETALLLSLSLVCSTVGNVITKPIVEPAASSEVEEPESEWVRSKTFPCPDAAEIYPCICFVDSQERIALECTGDIDEETFAAIFSSNFPVTEVQLLNIFDNSYVEVFDDFLNQLTITQVAVERCPNLREITQFWLANSRDTLKYLAVKNTKLTTETFPFISMDSYVQLEALFIGYSEFTSLPAIHSQTLLGVGFEHADISVIGTNTFARLDQANYINVGNNSLTVIPAGTFHFTNSREASVYLYQNKIQFIQPGAITFDNGTSGYSIQIFLEGNQLRTVDEEVFEPIMSHISFLQLFDNPLDCGCDILWLISNSYYMSKLDPLAACADGTKLTELDLQEYETVCEGKLKPRKPKQISW